MLMMNLSFSSRGQASSHPFTTLTVIVIAAWFLGFAYTLLRLGEAHRTHSAAAVTAQASTRPVPPPPFVASAE